MTGCDGRAFTSFNVDCWSNCRLLRGMPVLFRTSPQLKAGSSGLLFCPELGPFKTELKDSASEKGMSERESQCHEIQSSSMIMLIQGKVS